MRAPVGWMEWTLALRRRRLFILNVGIPLLLVLPLALGGAPVFHAAAVYAVLFTLFGTMGSAIPLLREGEAGLLRRIVLTGYPARRHLLERIAAGTLVDFLQLLPSLFLILMLGSPQASVWLVAPTLLFLALAAANLVGLWVAALARSLAEGALFAAVTSLFLLHGSGVFRTPVADGAGAYLQRLLPFGPLHRVLLEASGGTPSLPPLQGVGFGVLLTLGFLVLTAGCAAFLSARLGPASH